MTEADESERERLQLLTTFRNDRKLAHRVLFKHRHPDETPEAHDEVIDLWNSVLERVGVTAFRGFAKSTLSEETMLLDVLFEDFEFGIIVGESHGRACDRLDAIKHELEENDFIRELFQIGSPKVWSEDEIVLSNGRKLQALGAGVAIRGAKKHAQRPDYILLDDIENEESIATTEARRKRKRWFYGTLLPIRDIKRCKIRIVGSILHPDGLMAQIMRDPRWNPRVYPIRYIDQETGEWRSTWPDRYTLEKIDEIEQEYMAAGQATEFAQEYLCMAENEETKVFKPDMMPTMLATPVAHCATYVMVDPARTTNKLTSARTGYVAWSWLGRKLRVRKAYGKFHQPSEMVAEIFKLNDELAPVGIGVELDGLEQFISEPLRKEMLQRGTVLPIMEIRAPKDKDGFIRGLQPFFQAGEVEFEMHMPDLVNELLAFPAGRKDVPNALAYCTKLRVGKPVYGEFNTTHIEIGLELSRRTKPWLLVSARGYMTTGLLVQLLDGKLRVFGDWVKEGPPADALEGLVQEAIQVVGGPVQIAAAAEQMNKYQNYGLPAAVRNLRNQLTLMGSHDTDRTIITGWLQRTKDGDPMVLVDSEAKWTINGLFAGYARGITGAGTLADDPTENAYKILFEPLEAFVSWFGQPARDEDHNIHYATTRDGRRYISSRR